MTQGGYDSIIEELKRLKTEERPAVIRAIEEARGHGDLSERHLGGQQQQALI